MQDLAEQTVRSLALWQPYASLMVLNGKIETRWVRKDRKPAFPLGKYMIYSAKQSVKFDEVERVSGNLMPEGWRTDMRYFIRGCPLFIADLSGIEDWTYNVFNVESIKKQTFVQWVEPTPTHKRILLHFENIQRIKAFPYKGKQGIGILTPEQKAKIELL